MLTCITRNSLAIAWRNSDYIGRVNTEIQFGELNTPGDMQSSVINSTTTVARLITNRLENNIRVLESQLEITIRADVTSTSIICVHDTGNEDSFTLRLLGIKMAVMFLPLSFYH